MRYKVTFATGFAVGYTLGAKAGRQRYEQIMSLLRGVAENPAVQETAGVLQAQASTLASQTKRTVTGKVAARFGGQEVDTPAAPYPSSPNGDGGPGPVGPTL